MAADLPGVLVGHAQDPRRPTGVTVVLLPEGTVGGVDVRGAAPGTRETDVLDPVNTIEAVHAVVLAGGSAFGLDAASGVMRWLEERGRGVPAGPARVPIVPAAVIFDLGIGDHTIRPDAEMGYRACDAAVPIAGAAPGNVGAGAGATIGKLRGPDRMMRGGVGIADVRAGGITMAAVVVVNAVGDVVDPSDGRVLAGARAAARSLELARPIDLLLAKGSPAAAPGTNTTVGALITDARLSKAQVTRLAQVAHDGLARTIRPVHTPMDGDTLFVVATGTAALAPATASPAPQGSGAAAPSPALPPDMTLLSILAAEVTAMAVLNAIRSAEGLLIGDLWLPAWRDRA
ncbi:MAG: P1 family peptidase [Candidatus Nanopelagicales bacterium]